MRQLPLPLDVSGRAAPCVGVTVRQYGLRWLEWRRRAGYRSVGTDRSRWAAHVLTTEWADRAMQGVTRAEAKRWVDALREKESLKVVRGERRKLRHQTQKNVLNLVRACFESALLEEIIESNPFRELTIGRRAIGGTTEETWTVLLPAEQSRVLEAMPTPERWIALFAMGTGLRQGEQWALELADLVTDVDEPFVRVRYSYHGHTPTKGGKPRRVPLFGPALLAADAWMGALSRYARENPRALAFPTRAGGRRFRGKTPAGWTEALERAELGRHVRWHDLRHTCAASLVSGWWGRTWSLEEVRQLLGHSSVQVTERYAHFAEDVLERAARETTGPGLARVTAGHIGKVTGKGA